MAKLIVCENVLREHGKIMAHMQQLFKWMQESPSLLTDDPPLLTKLAVACKQHEQFRLLVEIDQRLYTIYANRPNPVAHRQSLFTLEEMAQVYESEGRLPKAYATFKTAANNALGGPGLQAQVVGDFINFLRRNGKLEEAERWQHLLPTPPAVRPSSNDQTFLAPPNVLNSGNSTDH